MEKEECWETFLLSGKVSDYLSYRQAMKESLPCAESSGERFGEKEPDDVVKKYAGFY